MGFEDIPDAEIKLPDNYENFCKPVIILNKPIYSKKEMLKIKKDHKKFMRRLRKEDGKAINCFQ